MKKHIRKRQVRYTGDNASYHNDDTDRRYLKRRIVSITDFAKIDKI